MLSHSLSIWWTRLVHPYWSSCRAPNCTTKYRNPQFHMWADRGRFMKQHQFLYDHVHTVIAITNSNSSPSSPHKAHSWSHQKIKMWLSPKKVVSHTRILIHLQDSDKIDCFCCDPDPLLFLDLHQIVTSCLLHGPYSDTFNITICMKDGLCTKDFPKKFCFAYHFARCRVPVYQYHDDRHAIIKNVKPLNNRHV